MVKMILPTHKLQFLNESIILVLRDMGDILKEHRDPGVWGVWKWEKRQISSLDQESTVTYKDL